MTVTEPYSSVGPPYDPPPARQFVGPLESVVRHPIAALLPVLLLVGIAFAIGASRSPTYTAEARVSVGRVDVPPFTLQNVVNGNQALAVGYARAIVARRVLLDAGRNAGLTPEEAATRLTASPIPGSTLIRVEGTGTTARRAEKLANGGARALIAYVVHLQASQQHSGLLAQFRSLQATIATRRTRLDSLRRRHAPQADVEQARISLLTALLENQRVANLYNDTQNGPSPSAPLQVLTLAASASSDKTSTLERTLLVGAAAGLALGIGIALALANGLRRRRR